MIRRRADGEHDDSFVHMWLNDATQQAEASVCGKPGPPSRDETGPPCMTCALKHGNDLADQHGDVSWRL